MPRLVPYFTPRRRSGRTGEIVYQFVAAKPTTGEDPMNVAQMIAGIIAQGLVKIPNQSSQTLADGQAFALAAGTYLSDLAKDELIAELNRLPLSSLIAKLPQLAGLASATPPIS